MLLQLEVSNKKVLCLMNLYGLIKERDLTCKNELCVTRHTFNIISEMVRGIGGLSGTKKYVPPRDNGYVFVDWLSIRRIGPLDNCS